MSCIAFDGSKTISFGIGELQSISPQLPSRSTARKLYRQSSRDFQIKSGSRVYFTAKKEKGENGETQKYALLDNEDIDKVNLKKKNYQQIVNNNRETARSNRSRNADNNDHRARKATSEDNIKKKPHVINNINKNPHINNSDKNEEILRLQNKMAKLQNKVATMQKKVLYLQKKM